MTRSLIGGRVGIIRSATARISRKQTRPLKTSAHEVREQAVQLLSRAQEFAKLNSYPEQIRADITLHLWNVCLPLERYAGSSNTAMESELISHLRSLAGSLDEILLSNPEEDVPTAENLRNLTEKGCSRFQPLLDAC